MPGNLMFADLSFPTIGEGESTKVSLQKVQNYLFLLLENLRYVLQNLEPGNFNEVEMEGYFKKLTADLVVADVVISNTIITNELYADYGSIADLTVDKLRTDYKKAANYLAGNKSPIDYISIHDEEISFISATTDGSRTEQLTLTRKAFATNDMTITEATLTVSSMKMTRANRLKCACRLPRSEDSTCQLFTASTIATSNSTGTA